MASQPPNRRGAWIALLTSWVLVLGIIAAGLGYAFLVPEERSHQEAMAPPEDVSVPSAAKPDPDPAQSGGETDWSSPAPEAIAEDVAVESPTAAGPGEPEAAAPERKPPKRRLPTLRSPKYKPRRYGLQKPP